MQTKLDLNVLNDILKEKSWKEALDYKDSLVPNVLYKYYPIFDERYKTYEAINEERFKTLRNNKLWVSSYKNFNDPFEFKMFTIDKERLIISNWDEKDIERVEGILEQFKTRTMVSCFSSEVDNNMPLWAHYANNHSGYCVKYTISNPKLFFPVAYEPVRVKTAVIPSMMFSEMVNSYRQNLKEPNDNFYKYFFYFHWSLACKHKFWEYEQEFRLLYPTPYIEKGLTISLDEIGLKVEAIYLGYKCNDNYKQKIMSIGKKLDCNIFEMYLDEYSEHFALKAKEIV